MLAWFYIDLGMKMHLNITKCCQGLFLHCVIYFKDPEVQVNHQWPIDDVTLVTSLKPDGQPTHCLWWQTFDGRHIAVVSTNVGFDSMMFHVKHLLLYLCYFELPSYIYDM